MNTLRRAWNWLIGHTEPDLFEQGRRYAVSADLTTSAVRPPEPVEAIRQRHAAREHEMGPAYQEEALELAAEQAEAQTEYDLSVFDLEQAAAEAQVAVRDQDKHAREQAKIVEADARLGRRQLFAHALLPHWVHWAYLGIALPGELAFMAVGFVRTDSLKVDILGHSINLGLGTALTMGIVVFAASYILGVTMVANLRQRQRFTEPNPLVRVALVGSATVGLVFALALPALRVILDNQAHEQAVRVLSDSFGQADLAEPNGTQTYLTFLGIYIGFFVVSALLAALTWDAEESDRRRANLPLDVHAGAVEDFLHAEVDLRSAHAASTALWHRFNTEADGLGQQFQQEISPFFEGMEAGHGSPLPERWADLRRVAILPRTAEWRSHSLVPELRMLTEERRQALLTIVQPADLPPLRPADRMGTAPEPVADAEDPAQPATGTAPGSQPPSPTPDPGPKDSERIAGDAEVEDVDLDLTDHEPIVGTPAVDEPIVGTPAVDDPYDPAVAPEVDQRAVMTLDDDPLGLG